MLFRFLLFEPELLMVILAFIVIFAAAGACLPLKEEPCRRSWIVTGLLCLPLLYLISSLLIVLIPSEMHWRSRFMCDLALGTAFTDKILPRNAREVAVKHKSCVIWITATWSCHVAEKDFLEFARSNGYQFAEKIRIIIQTRKRITKKWMQARCCRWNDCRNPIIFTITATATMADGSCCMTGRNRFCMGITVPGNGKPHFHRDGGTLNFCMESRVRSPRLLSHQSSKSMSSSS